jgi:hypothetical protein
LRTSAEVAIARAARAVISSVTVIPGAPEAVRDALVDVLEGAVELAQHLGVVECGEVNLERVDPAIAEGVRGVPVDDVLGEARRASSVRLAEPRPSAGGT